MPKFLDRPSWYDSLGNLVNGIGVGTDSNAPAILGTEGGKTIQL